MGGEYCVYEDQRYRVITLAEAAQLLGKSESQLGKPFLYRIPLGWLIFGPIFGLAIFASVREKRKTQKIARLFQDTRYQQALEIMNEEYARRTAGTPQNPVPEQPSPDKPAGDERGRFALDAGVQHLVSLGIDREEAEQKLTAMVQAMTPAKL